ncbi:MAG: hypothetical protein LBL84_00295 [Candidatus Nomurabacteria bacterium]|jgi:hypothetical protein|nr:hypothetical protein [Candidatus Nomurabacteria bacterium]
MTKLTKIVAGVGALGLLGLVALPITAYATDTASSNVTLNVDINETLSLDCTQNGTFTVAVANNATNKNLKVECKVTTNNGAGYTLIFTDKDADTNLVNGSFTIATSSGALSSASSMWGYLGSNNSGSTLTAIPTNVSAGIQMADTSSKSATSGDTYDAYFGVGASAAQEKGTYSDELVFTVTTK